MSVKTIRYIIEKVIKNSNQPLSIQDTAVACLNYIYTDSQYWLDCDCENVRNDVFCEIGNMIDREKIFLDGVFIKLNNELIKYPTLNNNYSEEDI